ncbi:helix-turn-helix transcriptional regulator [Bradyrhizobium iriomotense]|uniref:Transcriptional regulator n=1 Tax=Bradyrhizobium iriomotense TaxID=441950 RepID=A0ABQ6B939_9BRAD|nr:helix-turn-helix transcriptional regulator [Bradyrhizobium iriomotense]GLR90882.1 transcriptional regulator [Bradyrhizobium iriomotense]
MLDARQGSVPIYQSAMTPKEYSCVLIALDLISHPAILLDRDGSVLAVSGKASKVFDSEFSVHGRRIYVADCQSRMKLEALLDRARLVSEQQGPSVSHLAVNRASRRPIVMEAILRSSGSSSLPCEVSVVLLLTDLDEMPVISQASLMEVFGLTPVQAQLASLLAKGKSLDEIAREMNISSGTARNHLKAVFLRTATRRQGELVSLLSRLR